MTYKQNFVVCVKCDGKVLREHGDLVYLPFGSEYKILLKNLNTVRAVVKVTIDGKDIGGELVINPNSDVELERFIDGDLDKGYRFKFIEKTQEISDHRGDRAEDGLIRVEYRFEKKVEHRHTIIHEHHEHHHDHHHHDHRPWDYPYIPTYPRPYITWFSTLTCGSTGDSDGIPKGLMTNCNIGDSHPGDAPLCDFGEASVFCCSSDLKGAAITPRSITPQNVEGITVKGSDSYQVFHNTSVGELETTSEVIILKLQGTNKLTNYKTPSKPIAVRTKLKCSSCGRVSKSSQIFCGNCGTRLV